MPSTINAKNTTAGVVISPDTSGQLELQTVDTTRLTIDSSGNVGINTNETSIFTGVGGVSKLVVTGNNSATTVTNNQDACIVIANTDDTANNLAALHFAWQDSDNSPNFAAASIVGILGTKVAGQYPAGQIAFLTSSATNFAPSEKMRIDSSGFVTNAVNGLGNGLVQAQQYYRLNSTVTGANATGAQKIFGVGVTLVGSTVYEFEAVIALNKSAGTTSHTVSVGFGGTATLNNIAYELISDGASAAFTAVNIPLYGQFVQTASATAITAAQTSAARSIQIIIKGTVSVNAGGTFIPQYTLSAAPGGAYTTATGSYMKIAPIGASGSNSSVGTWA